ncbi:putative major facilitator superfamily transporter [Colletotrichum sublineola]|uniref:Putative major facilitator superfamily transporter n=1 Tax=Colletotrichum sublineola TaxID=1173701 RepID=A0A066XR85_COLSU|nr:putative major facilitator superfamily transporter [Colletotrichum sublineola]
MAAPNSDQPTLLSTYKTQDDEHTQQRQQELEQGTGTLTSATYSEDQYPSGLRLFLILFSFLVSMFLVALDRLIIATALPKITDDFHSVTDIGWYGSAYLLSTCAFQLLFGKLYAYFPVKHVVVLSVIFFEIGSAICGTAQSSIALIAGRAIAGVGDAGILAGSTVVLVYSVPLCRRPKYQGICGAVFAIASAVGPLLGGAFTSSHATWRWCFLINLPLGGVALLLIACAMKPLGQTHEKASLGDRLRQLDIKGTIALIPGVVCLLLALQWGGIKYAWNAPRSIILMVLAAVLLLVFVAIQVLLPETATIPPGIIKQRSIVFSAWISFFFGGQLMIFLYFIPVYLQAIKGFSAIESGIRILPLILSITIFGAISGTVTTRIGYYNPVLILGACVMAIGGGLLTTLTVKTEVGQWSAYQVIYGMGVGLSSQVANLAAQTVLRESEADVSVGVGIMFFSQTFGGAIFTSVGQDILNSQLEKHTMGLHDGIDLEKSGATTLTNLPAELRGPLLDGYNVALRAVFVVGLILVCFVVVGAGGLEWRSVKGYTGFDPKNNDSGSLSAPEQMLEGKNILAQVDKEKESDETGPTP